MNEQELISQSGSFKIEYFENVPLKGSCKLLDNQLKTSTNNTLTFPAAGGELALKTDIQAANAEVDLSGIEADIADIEAAITTISSNAASAKSTAESVSSDIDDIQSDITTINSNISASAQAGSYMVTEIQRLQTKIDNLESRFTTALIKACYPVGTVMIRYDNANPNTLTGFSGTTWSTFDAGISNATAWRRTA